MMCFGIKMFSSVFSVIATNIDLHHVPIWSHHGDKIIKEGENLTLTCSLAGLKFFDVLRVTHVQGTTTRTLSDNANVKTPYSRIPRYVVHHVYNDVMATVSVSYNGWSFVLIFVCIAKEAKKQSFSLLKEYLPSCCCSFDLTVNCDVFWLSCTLFLI